MELAVQVLLPFDYFSFLSRRRGPTSVLLQVSIMLWFATTVWAAALWPLATQVSASPLSHAYLEHSVDTRGAVASESDICSRIGINTIQDGGNAADAVSILPMQHGPVTRADIDAS